MASANRKRAIVLGTVMAAFMAAPAVASLYGTQALEFVMMRDGDPIGNHSVSFRRVDQETQVDVVIDIEVSLAFVTLFRYQHRNREVWQDGRLIALESWTDDDGEEYRVSARAVDGGLMVEGSSGRFMAPADIIPTSYWHPETVAQDRLLDTQSGRILEVAVKPEGSETIEMDGVQVPAERYSLSGDLTMTLWYGPGKQWVKTTFEARGAEVEYNLASRPEDGSPAQLPGATSSR
ncbi:MAG: DUF6134 family protein [Alphaproteobacteria bacterium]|nr:DUF6134 family protein [Alphaproteobacteria bacterium]